MSSISSSLPTNYHTPSVNPVTEDSTAKPLTDRTQEARNREPLPQTIDLFDPNLNWQTRNAITGLHTQDNPEFDLHDGTRHEAEQVIKATTSETTETK